MIKSRFSHKCIEQYETEESHQRRFFEIVWSLIPIWPDFDLIIHIPNSGAGPSKGMAGRMKAMGVKKGVSDIFYPAPRHGFSGLWIELKSLLKGARTSQDQRKWLCAMDGMGFDVAVCYGANNSLERLIKYETGKRIDAAIIKQLPMYYQIGGDKKLAEILKKIEF